MDALTQFQLSDLSPEQVQALVAAAVGVGAVYCFLGYRLLRFIIALTGFLVAGAVAAALAALITNGHAISTAVVGVLGGICGAMALSFLYRAGVFLLGLLGAALVAYSVLPDTHQTWAPLSVLAIGVLGGLTALLLEQPVVILATAAIGAWIVVFGVAYFLTGSTWVSSPDIDIVVDLEEDYQWLFGVWVVLAIIGAFSQWSLRKRAAPKKS